MNRNRLPIRSAVALALAVSATWLTVVGTGATNDATSVATERLMAALDQAARRPARAYKAQRSLKAGLTSKGESNAQRSGRWGVVARSELDIHPR